MLTPIAHGTPGRGIYSLAFKDEQNGIVAGGNWEEPNGDSTVAYTENGGVVWKLGTGSSGYRSGSTHVLGNVYLSVGTSGTDISLDGGASWKQIHEAAFNTVMYNEDLKRAALVGNKGTALIINFEKWYSK